jgi:hypothetical protein
MLAIEILSSRLTPCALVPTTPHATQIRQSASAASPEVSSVLREGEQEQGRLSRVTGSTGNKPTASTGRVGIATCWR